jgi:SAM-dependent methyltransferase
MNDGQAEKLETQNETSSCREFLQSDDSFSKLDESDDSIFYATDRFVQHIDSLALATVERIIGELVIEDSPVILDLMAGWDSHIPSTIQPQRVLGLGLNRNELSKNQALTEYHIHDLNKDPSLPFPDCTFDTVLNVVSVDYLTKPIDVFREVGRILKPGGLFLVIFSNRMFEQKAVKIWRQSGEEERVVLVEEFFKQAGIFTSPKIFVSKGKPRPKNDKYAHLGIPSDPIYAVYAEKSGGGKSKRPDLSMIWPLTDLPDSEELERRKKGVKDTFLCPHCNEGLLKWELPQNPFTQWDMAFLFVCFNDRCPFLLRGWEVMYRQGNMGMSYRFAYNPDRDQCMSVPVPSLHALKEGIVE